MADVVGEPVPDAVEAEPLDHLDRFGRQRNARALPPHRGQAALPGGDLQTLAHGQAAEYAGALELAADAEPDDDVRGAAPDRPPADRDLAGGALPGGGDCRP